MLQTFCATFLHWLVFFGLITGWSFFFFLFTTRFWWFSILYAVWLIFDRNTPDTGGRPFDFFIHNWLVQHAKKYFSAKIILDPSFTLDSKRNYLFSCYPHSILPAGLCLNLTGSTSDLLKLYCNFKLYLSTLRVFFYTPLFREWTLAAGLISCSEIGLNSILSKSEGGNIVNLVVGGSLEMSYLKPYKIVIKQRKGFVRVALKNGAPLVPVFTFGESDVFQHVKLKKTGFQEFIRKTLGFAPVLVYGRWYALIPQRCTLTTVVGKPIDVVKIENPSSQQIDEVHEIFVEELVKLFEKYKWEFVKNPEKVFLELE